MIDGPTDARVVFHQDDVGMCHGANVAFRELRELGIVTSGSVMVPCPWFAELAEMAAGEPALDTGVHLTLTAEKPHYRWGPLVSVSPSAGLTDPDGYLWRDVASVRRNAHPDAVEIEFRAQIERALAAGIDVTHLDAHMGCALATEFADIYLRLGTEYRLPILLTETVAAYTPNKHLVGVSEAAYGEVVERARELDQPIFDRALETDFQRTTPAEAFYRSLIESIGPGLSFLALHPNAPGEIEVIEPGTSYIRTDEHALFADPEFRSWVAARPVEWIGFRVLRDEYRARRGAR